MKRTCILLVALTPLAVAVQPAGAGNSLESQLSTHLREASSRLSAEAKPNEIVKGNVTYSGIVVQALKTDNLLQLANPAAPAKYGSAEDNVLRDSVTRGVSGWKLFSIRF